MTCPSLPFSILCPWCLPHRNPEMAPTPWGNSHFPEMQNSIPAKQNTCYRNFRSPKESRIHDRAPRDFPFGPEPRRPIPIDSRVAGDAGGVAHFPGAGRRWSAGPSPSRRTRPDSGFADEPLTRPKAGRQASSRTALGEGGEGKPMRNFPACKPLKYHKTAKYSGADAVMKTPPAGSPR